MKSNKKDYHLQAKRKAFQEANAGTITAVTAEAQPVVTAKKTTTVKVNNKGQTAKVSEVAVASAEPGAVETSAT